MDNPEYNFKVTVVVRQGTSHKAGVANQNKRSYCRVRRSKSKEEKKRKN